MKKALLCGLALALLLGLPASSPAQAIRAALDAYQKGDYATAAALARPLAGQGNAVAQGLLGVMYEYGRGVPKDFREALRWYRKAADQEMAPAQFSVGAAYAQGREVPKDDREAVKWFRRAADQDYAPAQFKLGVAYAIGAGVMANAVRAHMWLSLAARRKFESQDLARKALDDLEKKMTPAQIAEADQLAEVWKGNGNRP